MAFGVPPFGHVPKLNDKEKAICDPSYPIHIPPKRFAATVDPQVCAILKMCLRRNATERPTTEELLNHFYLTRVLEFVSAAKFSPKAKQAIIEAVNSK
jgi:hypothetical protein